MAILSKGARPEFGVDSHYELDRALLAGFLTPGEELGVFNSLCAVIELS